MLGLVFAMNMLARGVVETWPVFLPAVEQAMGWSRSEVASVYSVLMVVIGLGGALAGWALDRVGPRAVYVAGLLLLGGGYGAASWLDGLWPFRLAIGVAGGLGAAAIGMVSAQTLISRWFDSNVAAAMAFASTGLGFGTLWLAPLTQVMIDGIGWRDALQTIGGGVLVVAAVVVFLPWRRIAAGPIAATRRDSGPALREAVRSRPFWALFAAFFGTGVGMFAISVQSVAYMTENGVDPIYAAGAFGIAGVMSIAGMLGSGFANDRWGRRATVTVTYALSIIGILALAALPRLPAVASIVIFIACFGSTMGARSPVIAALSAQLFRGRSMGAIYGIILMGQGTGAATGSWLAGVLHDATGGYGAIFLTAVGSLLGCIALFWLVPEFRTARDGAPPPR